MPVTLHPATESEPRSVASAIWNGTRLRCPHCGKGHMFRAYLKVADKCDVCGEELFHHRADDMPPYLSILIVGHLIVGIMLEMELHGGFEPWVYMVTMVPAAVLLPLVLLPRSRERLSGCSGPTACTALTRAAGTRTPLFQATPDRRACLLDKQA